MKKCYTLATSQRSFDVIGIFLTQLTSAIINKGWTKANWNRYFSTNTGKLIKKKLDYDKNFGGFGFCLTSVLIVTTTKDFQFASKESSTLRWRWRWRYFDEEFRRLRYRDFETAAWVLSEWNFSLCETKFRCCGCWIWVKLKWE